MARVHREREGPQALFSSGLPKQWSLLFGVEHLDPRRRVTPEMNIPHGKKRPVGAEG